MSKLARTFEEETRLELKQLRAQVQELSRATAPGVTQMAPGTTDLVVGTVYANCPGCLIPITKPGRYLFLAQYDTSISGFGAGLTCIYAFQPIGYTSGQFNQSYKDVASTGSVRESVFNICTATFRAPGSMGMGALINGAGATVTIFGVAGIGTSLTAWRTGPV